MSGKKSSIKMEIITRVANQVRNLGTMLEKKVVGKIIKKTSQEFELKTTQIFKNKS